MKQIMIIGATSAIAQSVARLYASRGARMFLVARNPERLAVVADDLRARGAVAVDCFAADLAEHSRHAEILHAAWTVLPAMDTVLVAHGVLPDQSQCQASVTDTMHALDVNFLSVVSLLTPLANQFEANKRGTLVVISSVAGDRGRQSNYVYGSAKSGLDAFLQGLRNRLSKAGVHVVTIKPGFVATPMTAHLPQQGPLWAQPDDVAEGIVKAIDKQKDVVYLPGFWALIMLIIRLIPERIFKRLSL
jgi:short-subunit dehydrogenase